MMIVTSADGRQKNAPLGGTNPEILARLTLVELETAKSEWSGAAGAFTFPCAAEE